MYGNSQDNVEFIHPKLREEMPDNGEGGDPDNPWVWLTSYSRIPVFHTFIWSNMQLYDNYTRVAVKYYHQIRC